jgi:hypothetical protein
MKGIIILISISLIMFASLANAQVSISCPTCYINNCQCSIAKCDNGAVKVYNTTDCSGIPNNYYYFSSAYLDWHPNQTGNYYLVVLCSDGNVSDCTLISVTVPATTTTISGGGGGGGGGGDGGGGGQTTTTVSALVTTTTISTNATTTTSPSTTVPEVTTTTIPVSTSLTAIISSAIIILAVIAIAAMIYLKSRKTSKNDYEKLKEKYRKPK